MNRLIIGLGTIACLGFTPLAIAANGSVAGAMPKDYWAAVKRNEALYKPTANACSGTQADAILCKPGPKAPRKPV